MKQIICGLGIYLVVALFVYKDKASTLASENAKHEQLIGTLVTTNENQAQAIIEHEARALEIERALFSRNTELKQLAQSYSSQQAYLTELTRSNDNAKAFVNTNLPGSIACLFTANPEAADDMPAANCSP